MNTIEDLRNEIDDIDRKVAKLLSERILVAQKIGSIKKAENISVLNIDREIDVLDNVRKAADDFSSDEQITDAVERIYLSVITLTRRLQ